MTCLFAQKKKSEYNRKKRSIEELRYSFTEKKESYTESLNYSSCCYKMQGKSP